MTPSEIKRSSKQALIEAEIRIKSEMAVRKVAWMEAVKIVEEWVSSSPTKEIKDNLLRLLNQLRVKVNEI